MLLWNVNVEKCELKRSIVNEDITSEFKKFNLKNIPNSFLLDHLRMIEDLIFSLELDAINQHDLDVVYNDFVVLLKTEMLEKLDYKVIKVSSSSNNKKRRVKKPWWSNELSELWNNVCNAEKNMLNSKSDARKRQCRQEFTQKRKFFDREAQRAQRRYGRNQLNEINDTGYDTESSNQTEFWKKIGRVGIGEERRKAIPMSVQLENGSVAHDKETVLKEWKRSFCALLNPSDNVSDLPVILH